MHLSAWFIHQETGSERDRKGQTKKGDIRMFSKEHKSNRMAIADISF